MARVKTFANGGSLLPGDLNAIEDDYEFGFSTYKQVTTTAVYMATAASGTTYTFQPNGDKLAVGSGAVSAQSWFYLDPADFTGNTRANKYRLRMALFTNATAPTSTFTFGLYPITAVAGGPNVNVVTLGAVVAGSTVAFAAPAASSTFQGNSGDFTAPAAGYYAVGVAITVATQVANSSVTGGLLLQNRQV